MFWSAGIPHHCKKILQNHLKHQTKQQTVNTFWEKMAEKKKSQLNLIIIPEVLRY